MPSSPFDWLGLIKALAPAAGAAVGGALQGDPFQRRESFKGTSADPVKLLTDYMGQLNQFGGVLGDRLKNPNKGLTRQSIAQAMPGFAADPAAGDASLLQGRSTDLKGLFGGGSASKPSIEDFLAEHPNLHNSTPTSPISADDQGTGNMIPTGRGGRATFRQPPAGDGQAPLPANAGADIGGDPFAWMQGPGGANAMPGADWADFIKSLSMGPLGAFMYHKKGGGE